MARTYELGPYRLDGEAEILFRGTEPVVLGKRAVALLGVLVERAGEPVAKGTLMEAAWPGLAVEEANLAVQIAALRRVFAEEASGDGWIETLPRRGYRYVGPATANDESAATASSLPSTAALLALPDKPSIAVLPFRNMSDDPKQAYFADGLTEDIITALSLWRSFPVISRTSTFMFKERAANVQDVGHVLGARYILEGSVRREGNRVRVAAQLVDSETGHHVWAETFNCQIKDLFDLQDELTKKIAAKVAPEVERVEYRRVLTQRPQSLDAWHFIQRGTAELDEYTKEGNIRARAMFAQAIERDPNYARAFAGVALSYNRDLMLGYASSRGEAAAIALRNALKSVALDRSDSFAHSVLGMAHVWSGQQDEAKLSFERSVELNPSNGYARASLGGILDLMGQSEEGISLMEEGIRLNPNAPNMRHVYWFLARALICANRYEQAVEWLRKGIDADNKSANAQYLLAIALAHLGRLEQARGALDRCEGIQPGFVKGRADWRPYADSARNEHLLDGVRKVQRQE